MRFIFFVSVLLGLCSTAVYADENQDWYVGGAIGTNNIRDFDIDRQPLVGAVAGTHTTQDIDMKNEPSYSAVIGYRFNKEWSLQGEWTKRSNKSDSVKQAGVSLANSAAKLKSDALMANVIYTVQGFGDFRPYVGLGIGAAKVEMEKDDSLGGSDDSDWDFAYQGLLGAEVSMSQQWSVYGQYQYFKTSKTKLNPNSVLGTSELRYELDSYPANQTFSIGLRYGF